MPAAPPPVAAQESAGGGRSTYFPGLDGLRFLAAYAVVFHHMEQILHDHGYPSAWNVPVIQRMGPQAVRFFFVLSGYLITFLLLLERERTGDISVPKFYMRRILRIWPLYYLIVALGLWVLPAWPQLAAPGAYERLSENRGPITALFLLILPNVVLSRYGAIPHISITWSIGLEEQFYLVWPVLMRWVRRPLLLIAGVFCVFPGLQMALPVIRRVLPVDVESPAWQVATGIASQPFHAMAIGALAACAHHGQWHRYLGFIYRRPVQIATLVAIAAMLALPFDPGRIASLLLPVCFAVLIQNVAANPASLLRCDWAGLRRLGQISYGVYMYHALLVAVALHLVRGTIGDPTSPAARLAYYVLATGLTIGVSWASYRWFESPLLAIKDRFAVVRSGSR